MMPQKNPLLPGRYFTCIFVLFILSCPAFSQSTSYAGLTTAINPDRIRQTIEQFSTHGPRLAGYPACDTAATFIEASFRASGLQDIRSEPFSITVPVDQGGTLELPNGTRLPIHGLWPNLIRTPTLPAEGLNGPLIYGGSGAFPDLDGQEIEGAIVLMEYNTWNNWLNSAMLGAQAIVFIEPNTTTHIQGNKKFLQIPLRTPRFWISQENAQILQDHLANAPLRVQLESRMDWENRTTYNILGRLAGSDAQLRHETVLIEAYYDGMSVVPSLAPAAETASSTAALLEIARYLAQHPPKRSVLFAATSAHHLGRRGMSAFLQRHARKESHYAKLVPEPLDIKLCISLDLSSHTDELGVWNSSAGIYQRRFFAPFGNAFMRLAAQIAPALDRDPATALYNGITPVGGLTWDNLVPGGQLVTNAQLALEAGIPALTFVTVNDARLLVDTPFDTPQHIRFDHLTRQTQMLAGMLSQALDDPDLFPRFRMRLEDTLRGVHGRVLTFPRRSIAPDKPRPGAIVALRTSTVKSSKGVRRSFYTLTDSAGQFDILGLTGTTANVQAYYLDPEDGEVVYAPNLGTQAKIYPQDISLNWWRSESTTVLFPCIATDFFDLVDPRFLNKLSAIQVYDATNSTPQDYGHAIGLDADEPVGVLFTRPGEHVKLTMSAGLMGIRFALLNAQGSANETEARGIGLQTNRPGAFVRTAYQSANDMWQLNEARIQELKRFAIDNARLDQLHLDARHNLDLAATALEQKRWSAFIKYTRAAMGLEARAYPDVKSTQNDVVHGIVFFMALLIPCAFFAERLLIAAADIRAQIGGFALIFSLIWICISLVHPAFELSNPLVVLLAFIILALAVFVLVLVLSKFNGYMREMGTETPMVHQTDISRIGATYTAFILGISNMRRRKLRTALTFFTLLLLTFTVLSFTSIQTELHFSRVRQDRDAAYTGALVRNRTWTPLPESTYDYARADFRQAGTIAPRSWYRAKVKNLIKLFYGGKDVQALGIIGLTPDEIQVSGADRILTAGTWFTDGREKSCLLPVRLAALLDIHPKDAGQAQVRLFGESFLVRGLFDPARLDNLLDLDGEPLTPVAFDEIGGAELLAEQKREAQERLGTQPASVEMVSFTHRPADQVFILPYQLLRELGGDLQSVAIRLDDPAGARHHIEAFLSRLAVTLFAGLPEADGRTLVWTYNSLGLTAFGGLGSQFIPLLIAGLIVLNTMMGAVYERLPEIGIYSSVGLAPLHIAFLFIAEACVYAVLGVVGGYLVGQVTAKVLLAQGLLSGISLNYSSLAAVTAAGLVMGVVLLSSIYPARTAAYLAVPDVTRRWKLPEPNGDRWDFIFPFTVSGAEVLGLFAFLATYFKAYSEESIGTFYTQETQLERTPGQRGCHIRTHLWLAPFDLGVSQHLTLHAAPTDSPVFEVTLGIQRLSGEPSSWHRTNQRFVNILRKQFLIWRTLSQTAKDHYATQAEELIAAPLAPVAEA